MILRGPDPVEAAVRAQTRGGGAWHLIAMLPAPRLAMLLVCLGTMAVLAQAPVALDAVGPQPGTVVPAFSLVDQTGATRSLASIMGRRGAMLVFSRSADW